MDEAPARRPRLRIGLWPAVAIVAVVISFIVYSEMSTKKAAVGQPAPSFTLNDLSDKPVSLSDYRGGITIINFWASWCGPCREETPALQTFASRYGQKVTLLGVNYQEKLEKITPFIQEFGVTYKVLRDTDGKVAERYKMKALPESWFIDEGGVARIYWIGTMNFEDMRDAYRSTTGLSIDGDRLPGDAKRAYRVITRNGFYLQDSDRIWQSNDGGTTWANGKLEVAPGLNQTVRSIAWAGNQGMAWVEGKGLFHTNNGTSWSLMAQSTLAKDLPDVALAISADGKQLWAGSMQGLYSSTNQGKTWRKLSFGQAVSGIAVSPYQSGRLLVATSKGIWSMGIDGSKASLLPGSPVRKFDDVAIARIDGKATIVAVAPNSDVYTTDGSGAWNLRNP